MELASCCLDRLKEISLASHSGTSAWQAAGFAVLSIFLYFVALCCSHLAAFRTATNMKKAAMHHIVTLPLGYFSQNASDRLRKIVDDNAGLTEGFLAHQLPDLTGAVVMPIAEEDPNPPLGRYEKYPVKDAALLMTSADDLFWTYEQAVSYYQFTVINYIGFHDKGMLLAGGCGDTNGKPQIDKTNHLKEAYQFGRTIYAE